ncbi:MAG: cysteine synthase CysM [Bacteroidales bacterium]|nr:cysteine synthase CysM [Bacteroidales bacterium]
MHSLISLIGNTPQIELTKIITNKNIRLFAKLEGKKPGGSVKDRTAYGMIKGALERGEISQNIHIIEPTSGNTGIALAMIARLFNLKIELVMPEHATNERIKTMRAYGAKVTLTPSDKSMEGTIDYARQKVKEERFKMLDQFNNPDNCLAHYRSTGPEIWKDSEGRITHFVSAMGTTGTIMGTSRYLKEQNPQVQIIGARPTEGSEIPGIRRWPREYLPKIFDPQLINVTIDISSEEATEMTRRLAREEGIFAGMSSGGAVAAALKLSETIEKGYIVCIISDIGDRYLSSGLFS